MRYVAAAALAGLLLGGCGSGASQTLRSADDEAPDPTATSTSAPASSTTETSPAPDPEKTEDPARPTLSPRPTDPAGTSSSPSARPRRTSAKPDSSQVASAGTGSTGPGSTTGPAPSRSPSPRPAGQLVITEADSGKTFTISRDTADALLRLGDGWQWSQPEREGSSVELVQRQFVRDPGYAEWEIRPVSSGTTVVRSTGSLECHRAEPPCMAPNRLFEVRIVVS